jgi:aldose 1-epimerase
MAASVEMEISGKTPDGAPIEAYTLRSEGGAIAKVISYGATLVKLWMPDRDGNLSDVVLGFDSAERYVGPHPHFGGIVGRYANRIAKGKFTLDGKEYQLDINNPPNSLHGGKVGFDRRMWTAHPSADASTAAVRFSHLSADGEEGFPGDLKVSATYTLTHNNELRIDYTAQADKPTPLNLTNHTYFNFAGNGDVLGHVLQLDADSYTPVDATLIPTGEIWPVAGTPLDFRKPAAIGAHIAEIGGNPGGYDHNFIVNGKAGTLRHAARVYEPSTGREMEVWTTEPGIQFYSGNFLDGTVKGKKGVSYAKHSGFCLETQHYPDSVNHPNFPSVILRPGETYNQTTVFGFSAK